MSDAGDECRCASCQRRAFENSCIAMAGGPVPPYLVIEERTEFTPEMIRAVMEQSRARRARIEQSTQTPPAH